MKLIIAYVQPIKEGAVTDALHRLPGVTGATFSDARGFGHGHGPDADVPEVVLGTVRRVRVEVLVSDELAHIVAQGIREAAHTGERGDGKVCILAVSATISIASGAQDGDAL
ncbi:MAG TPA: P-II family nitrogen regulator [Gemmatimonadaceae bacterium]